MQELSALLSPCGLRIRADPKVLRTVVLLGILGTAEASRDVYLYIWLYGVYAFDWASPSVYMYYEI